MSPYWTRLASGVVFAVVLVLAFVARMELAETREYVHDEENTAIPLSKTISFDPEHLNLPLRGRNHGAMPAYFVKASSTLFGTKPLGYRTLHVLFGMLTIVLVYLMVSPWYGPAAAAWAAALLAFNEYYLGISSRATAHLPYLFFVVAAVFAFSRFLRSGRAALLYGAGAALGLAFYCKEHAALLLPVFFATLLLPSNRAWLRTPHPYLACLTFVLFIAPDALWNARTDPNAARVTYSGESLGQATYSAHLQRIGGIGLSPYPAMFYARRPVRSAYQVMTGSELRDETPEYESMNPVLGVLLVGAVLVTAFGPSVPRDGLRSFLLVFAVGIFAFFTVIKRGDPPYGLDPVSWIWVESTMVPAVVLTGARLAEIRDRRVAAAAWALTAAALGYSVYALLGA